MNLFYDSLSFHGFIIIFLTLFNANICQINKNDIRYMGRILKSFFLQVNQSKIYLISFNDGMRYRFPIFFNLKVLSMIAYLKREFQRKPEKNVSLSLWRFLIRRQIVRWLSDSEYEYWYISSIRSFFLPSFPHHIWGNRLILVNSIRSKNPFAKGIISHDLWSILNY